jgi:hypothetical protein
MIQEFFERPQSLRHPLRLVATAQYDVFRLLIPN